MPGWPTIVSELLDSGLTRAELARAVEAGVATINDIARGTTREPRYALGERLLQLHAARVGRTTKG